MRPSSEMVRGSRVLGARASETTWRVLNINKVGESALGIMEIIELGDLACGCSGSLCRLRLLLAAIIQAPSCPAEAPRVCLSGNEASKMDSFGSLAGLLFPSYCLLELWREWLRWSGCGDNGDCNGGDSENNGDNDICNMRATPAKYDEHFSACLF